VVKIFAQDEQRSLAATPSTQHHKEAQSCARRNTDIKPLQGRLQQCVAERLVKAAPATARGNPREACGKGNSLSVGTGLMAEAQAMLAD
jgi:hypothetical protein